MNCQTYDHLLDDYVDGVPDPDFERHLATCARCQALVADFTSIRRTASMLEEHVPPPRLWAQVAASIEKKQSRFFVWMPIAVAASLALLIAGASWVAWRQSVTAPARQAAVPAAATPPDAAAVPADAHYEQAIAGLQQLADAQDAALDPATRQVLHQNFAVIDRAISESRAALADDPANAAAQESLLDALDTKVALLQDTVALAADAGMADDAADAARELNQ